MAQFQNNYVNGKNIDRKKLFYMQHYTFYFIRNYIDQI